MAMDKANPHPPNAAPGVTIRNGPVNDMDLDQPHTNGNNTSKRKARGSLTNGRSYKETSNEDEDDDEPLVT